MTIIIINLLHFGSKTARMYTPDIFNFGTTINNERKVFSFSLLLGTMTTGLKHIWSKHAEIKLNHLYQLPNILQNSEQYMINTLNQNKSNLYLFVPTKYNKNKNTKGILYVIGLANDNPDSLTYLNTAYQTTYEYVKSL